MKQLLNVHKPRGLTPLQTIGLVRKKFPEYKDEKIGFAGRLDPLAHGVLTLMVGEETTKEKDKYLNLPKEYEFEAVFGVSTDTYDALGIISNEAMKQFNNENLKDEIENFIKSKLGKQTQIYPPYSSKTVEGKPLFEWARENKLAEIEVPAREIEIFDFKLLAKNSISVENLKKEIFSQVSSVQGDFRQNEIKEKWQDFFSHPGRSEGSDKTFLTARFTIACSSGTYVRSLVNDLGEKLRTGAIALEILRTKVGEYRLNDSLKLL